MNKNGKCVYFCYLIVRFDVRVCFVCVFFVSFAPSSFTVVIIAYYHSDLFSNYIYCCYRIKVVFHYLVFFFINSLDLKGILFAFAIHKRSRLID